MRGPWNFENPLCSEIGGDFWFPEKAEDSRELKMARTICGTCTHKNECIEWAVEHERFGIWGGTNETQRASIRRMRSSKQSA